MSQRLQPSPWTPSRAPFGSTWADFTTWVEWIDSAYEVDLPTCWVSHEGLVHTLAALWHLWRGVYARGQDGALPAAGGAASWHDTFFYPFRAQVAAKTVPGGGCSRNADHRTYTRRDNLTGALDQRIQNPDAENNVHGPAEETALRELIPDLGPSALIGILYPDANLTRHQPADTDD